MSAKRRSQRRLIAAVGLSAVTATVGMAAIVPAGASPARPAARHTSSSMSSTARAALARDRRQARATERAAAKLAKTEAPRHKIDPSLRTAMRAHPNRTVRIIVAGGRSHEAAIARMGGRITHDLKLIHGFSAAVAAKHLMAIAGMSGVRGVTADGRTSVQGSFQPSDSSDPVPTPSSTPVSLNPSGDGNSDGDGDSTDPSASTDPSTDPSASDPSTDPSDYDNSPSVFDQVIGADQLISQGDNGNGVTVALIDTGVDSMPDVANSLVPITWGDNTRNCINLSGDGTCDDGYGHGTFLAGLIAGDGASSDGEYTGVAPGAKILSVKIASANGAADVSTIIAAIEIVVATRHRFGTDVLNLSLGTDSTQSYLLDPLDYAVEQAWNSGIVVDVAAANLGPAPETIDDPADDPYVITVGAVDDLGTVDTSDDTLPDFTSRGPTAADGLAKPDVVAPGGHLVSLAAPGAAITEQFPPNMAAPYRRGSGTSMSTAVVSGLVADMLSAEPDATPDEIKYQLMAGAQTDGASSDPMAVGAGLVNGPSALAAGDGQADQGLAPAQGTGSLQASRGDLSVSSPSDPDLAGGNVISGDSTANGNTWNSGDDLLNPDAWSGRVWNGGNWYAGNWYGGNWYGGNWYGGNWYGGNWYGGNWYGGNWYGGNWYGAWDY